MFIDRLLNQGNVPVLQQVLNFTAQRHRLIAENIANIDSPNYRQKDLSVENFQQMLRQRVEQRGSDASASFDDLQAEVENPTRGMLFHDGNNRSAEQLFSDQAKNALLHNLVVELLRKQFQSMQDALREKVV